MLIQLDFIKSSELKLS